MSENFLCEGIFPYIIFYARNTTFMVIEQSSRLDNDATYGMSHEYMTFSNLYIVCRVKTQSFKINIYFLICDTAPTMGHDF